MKCSYCTSEIEKGTGMTYVKRNGTIRYYCSKRCLQLNIVQDRKLGRKELADRLKR